MSKGLKNTLIFFIGIACVFLLSLGFICIRVLLNFKVVNEHPSLSLKVSNYPQLISFFYNIQSDKKSLFDNQFVIVLTDKVQKQHQTAWKDENNNQKEMLGTSGDYSSQGKRQVYTVHIVDYPRITNEKDLAQNVFNLQFLNTVCQSHMVKGFLPKTYSCSRDFSNEINVPSNRIKNFLLIETKNQQ